MPRDDGLGDFRELLLLQRSSRRVQLAAGAIALLPVVVLGAVLAVLLFPPPSFVQAVAPLAYGALAGALAALAYRRGQIPYRRGDLAALAAFTVLSAPVLVFLARAMRQDVALGILLVFGLFPALGLEVCWRPLFLVALRRLAGLPLDTLVHESLREHYGDDWQAYRRKIAADLREARRLRDQSEGDSGARDEAK